MATNEKDKARWRARRDIILAFRERPVRRETNITQEWHQQKKNCQRGMCYIEDAGVTRESSGDLTWPVKGKDQEGTLCLPLSNISHTHPRSALGCTGSPHWMDPSSWLVPITGVKAGLPVYSSSRVWSSPPHPPKAALAVALECGTH